MNISLISRETIKPASPTPPHLKSYRLSSLDQFTPPKYIPMVLFYPNYGSNSQWTPAEKSCSLKSSLTQTLTQYYPFAGRFTGGDSIDCNDEGAEFIEAQIECALFEILESPKYEEVDQVFPDGLAWSNPKSDSSLLVIQLNYFDCGGIAIAVCVSYKIADACTLCNLLTYWAAMATQSGEEVSPHFISSPSIDPNITVPVFEFERESCITRRFEFHNSKIEQLKAMAVGEGVQINPTRVQVVSALLYKCANRANSSSFRPSILFLAVNMRSKMVSPLPETAVGNLYGKINVPTKAEKEMNLSGLTEKMKNGMILLRGVENLDGNEWWSTIRECVSNNLEMYMCSSFCRFPFYQVDFGWGKPIRVSVGSRATKNAFILMDTPSGDGIEALVGLDQQSMATFERDKELLAFASFNGNALVS